MPAPAVGTTTRRIVFQRGSPRASEPSRSSCGTSRRTSSVARATIGHINTTSASPPANAEKFPNTTTTTVQMKAPATIDGVESSTCETSRIADAVRPLPYSAR